MYSEIMYPNHEDGQIDWEDPEHEDEDGVSVVVEIIMGAGLLRILVFGSRGIDPIGFKLTVSLANLNARVQVASCTMHATIYAN